MLLLVAHTVLAGILIARRMAGGAGPQTVGMAEREAGSIYYDQEATPIQQEMCYIPAVPLLVMLPAFSIFSVGLVPQLVLQLGAVGMYLVVMAASGWLDQDVCPTKGVAFAVATLLHPALLVVAFAAGREATARRALLLQLASRRARKQADGVLAKLLPKSVNDRLIRGEAVPFEYHDYSMVILWADLVGFTAVSSTISSERAMVLLNELYSRFDQYIDEEPTLFKLDTIGDAYVIVSWVDDESTPDGEGQSQANQGSAAGQGKSKSKRQSVATPSGTGATARTMSQQGDDAGNRRQRRGFGDGVAAAAVQGSSRHASNATTADEEQEKEEAERAKAEARRKRMEERAPVSLERILRVACRMQEAVEFISAKYEKKIGIRIGVHAGPVATAIIGTLRPRLMVFGPTVLESEAMESEGREGRIQVSEAAYKLYLRRAFRFR